MDPSRYRLGRRSQTLRPRPSHSMRTSYWRHTTIRSASKSSFPSRRQLIFDNELQVRMQTMYEVQISVHIDLFWPLFEKKMKCIKLPFHRSSFAILCKFFLDNVLVIHMSFLSFFPVWYLSSIPSPPKYASTFLLTHPLLFNQEP